MTDLVDKFEVHRVKLPPTITMISPSISISLLPFECNYWANPRTVSLHLIMKLFVTIPLWSFVTDCYSEIVFKEETDQHISLIVEILNSSPQMTCKSTLLGEIVGLNYNIIRHGNRKSFPLGDLICSTPFHVNYTDGIKFGATLVTRDTRLAYAD